MVIPKRLDRGRVGGIGEGEGRDNVGLSDKRRRKENSNRLRIDTKVWVGLPDGRNTYKRSLKV